MRTAFHHIFGPAILLCLLLAGCSIQPWSGFPSPNPQAACWPPPPQTARLVHLLDVHDQEDLFADAGFWKSLGRWVGGPTDTKLSRPFAVALHPAGGLLVADPGRQVVHFYCWGKRKYIVLGRDSIGLPSPVGVAALSDGRILVSDSRLGTVESFDADGKRLAPFVAKNMLNRPAGIAVDEARGRVYVADVIGHRVGVFDTNGKWLSWIGHRGTGPGEFNFPTNLAVDRDGHLLVVDSMNFRVQILNPDGTFVRTFGHLGDAPGTFSRPKGIAVDRENHVIVVEGLYDGLEFFDEDGQFLLHVGNAGQGPGEFWLAAGLALDRESGRLFVADSYNRRVQVFQLLEDSPSTPTSQPESQPVNTRQRSEP